MAMSQTCTPQDCSTLLRSLFTRPTLSPTSSLVAGHCSQWEEWDGAITAASPWTWNGADPTWEPSRDRIGWRFSLTCSELMQVMMIGTLS